jgi:hypothetical protein
VKDDCPLVESIPGGDEVNEHPDCQVFLRKIVPRLVPPTGVTVLPYWGVRGDLEARRDALRMLRTERLAPAQLGNLPNWVQLVKLTRSSWGTRSYGAVRLGAAPFRADRTGAGPAAPAPERT